MSSNGIADLSAQIAPRVDPRVIVIKDPSATSEPDANSLASICQDFILHWFAFPQAQWQPGSAEGQQHPFPARWNVTVSERFLFSKFIIGFDQEEAIAHHQSMHLYAWLPSSPKDQDLLTWQLFLNVFTLRRHPNIVHCFLHHTLSLSGTNVHLVLGAGHGPTLHAYQANFRKLWPIESFRIFDHICAACEHLHSLQPEKVLHNALDDQHIVLDGRAVARGRSEAFLAGPIRLAYFDRAQFGPSTFEHVTGDIARPSNPYTIEASEFGLTLNKYLNIGVSDAHPRNCHPGLLKLLPSLLSKMIIMGAGIQKQINRCDGLLPWLRANGHAIEDFKDNMLCYQGNRPPCADPLDRPTMAEITFAPPKHMSLDYWQTFPEDRYREPVASQEGMIEYCRASIQDLQLFHPIELVKSSFAGKKKLQFDSMWHLYPTAVAAYVDKMVATAKADDRAVLQASIVRRLPLAMRVYTTNIVNYRAGIGQWFEALFESRPDRHPNLWRMLLIFEYATEIARDVYFVLFDCATVSLEAYLRTNAKLTPIEVFRVFDHICAACNYLNRLEPRRLVHLQVDVKHILLDNEAVARGAAHAYLDGPIRLADWDRHHIGMKDHYREAMATTKANLAKGPDGSTTPASRNPFLEQSYLFGRTLITIILNQLFVPRSMDKDTLEKYMQDCKLPFAFRFIFVALLNKQLMLSSKLQDSIAGAISRHQDFREFIATNGYTADDFRSNILVFRGRNPDVAYLFRKAPPR